MQAGRVLCARQAKKAEQNIPICHKRRLWQAQNLPHHADRHDNAPLGYSSLLLTLAFSFSPQVFLALLISLYHRWLLVSSGEGRRYRSNPQPHRRKSLLEHLLITTKSQTRARERSPRIRLCSTPKACLIPLISPFETQPVLAVPWAQLCTKLKPSCRSSWSSFTQRNRQIHSDIVTAACTAYWQAFPSWLD